MNTVDQNYGVYPNERVVVIMHGPNFYNAHRALGISSPDYLKLRGFFQTFTDFYGFYYFNAAPSDPEIHSPVENLKRFLECKGFWTYIKYVEAILPETSQPVIATRHENGFTGNRLLLASARPEYDTTPINDVEDDRPKMPRVALTSDIMTKVMRILLLSKSRPDSAIQRLVFVGGENDYAPWFDLFTDMGIRVTLIGLNRDSVSPNGFVPRYAMLPHDIRTGPVEFVDLSVYLSLIQREHMQVRAPQKRETAMSIAMGDRR
jgi:hypothetical protein